MKNFYKKLKKDQRGIATLEMMIALALIVMSISAVILVVFGNQSTSIDTQTSNEALYKARTALEDARATSRQDFNLVQTIPVTSDVSGPLTYYKSLDVSNPGNDTSKKLVTSTITWLEGLRTLTVKLSTILTITESLDSNCSDSDVSQASMWVGLASTDDGHTHYDIIAQIYNGATLIGFGQLNFADSGGTSTPKLSNQQCIGIGLLGSPTFVSGDKLNFQLSARISSNANPSPADHCTVDHGARLWYNSIPSASPPLDSHFSLLMNGISKTYYLRTGSALSLTPGSGSWSAADTAKLAWNPHCGALGPFQTFGTWSVTIP